VGSEKIGDLVGPGPLSSRCGSSQILYFLA
jgi:hypothetical protein